MKTSLAGRVALVTGAGRGIGEAIARALAEEGAALALVARTMPEVDRLAAELRAKGGRAFAFSADVANPAEIQASIDATIAALGPIDILVNNAAFAERGAIDEQSPELWRRTVDVNLMAPYFYCRGVMPGMVARGWGRVINIGSVMSKIGMSLFTAYTSSKHGLVGLTRALALEVADKGVTINMVCPGVTKSPGNDGLFEARSQALGVPVEQLKAEAANRIPMRSIASAEQVAPAVVFLASDAASRITGEAMNVSGGAVMH